MEVIKMGQYTIHEANMPRLEKKLAAIQKKCARYGCPFEYQEVGEIFKGYTDLTFTELTENPALMVKGSPILRFAIIEVSGTARVGDWQFIGTIEHSEPMNIIGLYAQNVEIPKEYFTARPGCDHCKTKRARRDTYIVRNVESGEFKQVGRACMKEYTKGLSAEAAASWISLFESLIEGAAPDTTSYTRYFGTVEILATAISVVDTFGYVKTRNEYDEYNPDSTKNNVCGYLEHDKYFLKRAEEKGMADPETNTERAKELIAWALTNEEDYGYMTNLMAILRCEYCEYKHIGLIASAVASYRRATEKREREEKARQERAESSHVGTIGQRISFEVKSFICLTSFETMYGYMYLYKITDTQDNIYIWKTSKGQGEVEGVNLTGTVKDHGEYNGEKQTELTRCKIKAAA